LIAGSKNRSVGGWAALGAFFGVFATIAVACCSKLPTEAEIAARREADPAVDAQQLAAEHHAPTAVPLRHNKNQRAIQCLTV